MSAARRLLRRLPLPSVRPQFVIALGVVLAGATIAAATHRHEIRRLLVLAYTPDYELADPNGPLAPRFTGADAGRKQIAIDLQVVAKGIEQPTDIQFPPGAPGYAVVLSKPGTARWLRLADGRFDTLFRVEVKTDSEEGLLGLAFHPRFTENGRFFVNYVAAAGGKDVTRVAEWHLTSAQDFPKSKAEPVRVLLEVEQPYPNHDGGCLAFGPDGYLYVGLGDGGYANDPHGHGQDGSTLLGSMLRIDVNARGEGREYGIPKDNPFLGNPKFAPETWAYGLRNPWRYSFDPKGRLVIADVGQNAWEEIDIAKAGDNLGWTIREGFACFQDNPGCARKDLVDPVLVYGRSDGISVTGGYVYTGKRIPELSGLYVFGDFGSGRLFALALPDDRSKRVEQPIALGQWPMMPSTFGRDLEGELYAGDFQKGEILRIVPAPAKSKPNDKARDKR